MSYGYVATENIVSKNGGIFGLNQGTLVSLDLIQDETGSNYIDLVVKVGDREFKGRYYEPTKVYFKNTEITEGDPNFAEQQKRVQEEFSATLISIAEAFVPKEIVEAALATGVTGFVSFVTKLINLVNTSPNKNQPLDIFLQYQSKVVDGKQFLEIPKNVKQGYFITPHQEGVFKENLTANGLTYINEQGVVHKFMRSNWFMTQSPNGVKMDIPEVPENYTNNTPDALPPSEDPFNV